MTIPLSQLVSRIQQPDCAANLAAANDAGVQATVTSDYRTAAPLNLQKLFQWASDNAIVETLQATLADTTIYPAVVTGAGLNLAQTTAAINAAITYILQGVSGNLNIDTTDPTRAAKTYNLLQLMGGVYAQDQKQQTPKGIGLSPTQITTFLGFGGGVVWGPNSCAVADVTTARQCLTYQQASQAKRAAIAAGYNACVEQMDSADAAALANPATATVPTGTQLQATFAGQVGN